jgi:ATP-dependent Clp protease ATP-binding subunit ClpB
VRRRPYAVILFDEVEKAHQDVWNVLLQVLDDGRLTDSQGRTVDFKNTVIILTSNIASAQMTAIEENTKLEPADKKDLMQRAAMEAIRGSFRPEFINRLDDVVVFQSLGRESIRSIVDIQLQRFAARLARRELSVTVSDKAKDAIGLAGWDPQFGARPLKRAIQRMLEDPLARKVLAGEFPHGTTIQVDVAPSGELSFAPRMQN